jgi:hypothetical protein
MYYAVYLDKKLGRALTVPEQFEIVFDNKRYKPLDFFRDLNEARSLCITVNYVIKTMRLKV